MSHLDKVKSLYRSEKFKEAISFLEQSESECLLHPAVLVWKARCLQLADDISPYQLSDIEKLLKQALSVDSEYLPAIVDLAYFYLNVLDDSKQAAPLFREAINLHKEAFTEAVIGMAECLAEESSKEEALKFLANTETSALDANKLQEVKEELLGLP